MYSKFDPWWEHQAYMKIIKINFTKITTFPIKNLRNKSCLEPFGSVSIDPNGDIRMCGCSAWMPTVVGNIFKSSLDHILDSPLAIDIRNSIRDGSYKYCNEKTCGMIVNDLLPTVDQFLLGPAESRSAQLKLFFDESSPKISNTFFIAGDLTCNLSCPSCRTTVINNSDHTDEQNKNLINIFTKNLESKNLEDGVDIRLSTSGEVLASPLLLGFLESFDIKKYPKTRFHLQSNGLLFKTRWHRIEHLKNNISSITITADSNTKSVYEKLRRGGKFEQLVDNLAFIQKLKTEIDFDFSIRSVLQVNNIEQVESFYQWSKNFGANFVEYVRIANWGTYSPEEFDLIDVLNYNHTLYSKSINRIQNLKKDHSDVILFGFNLDSP